MTTEAAATRDEWAVVELGTGDGRSNDQGKNNRDLSNRKMVSIALIFKTKSLKLLGMFSGELYSLESLLFTLYIFKSLAVALEV